MPFFFGIDDALLTLVSTSALLWTRQGRTLRCTVQRTLASFSCNRARPTTTTTAVESDPLVATGQTSCGLSWNTRVPISAQDHRLRLRHLLQRFDRPSGAESKDAEGTGSHGRLSDCHDSHAFDTESCHVSAAAHDALYDSAWYASSHVGHSRAASSRTEEGRPASQPLRAAPGGGLRVSQAYRSVPCASPWLTQPRRPAAAPIGDEDHPHPHHRQPLLPHPRERASALPQDSARHRHAVAVPSVLTCRRRAVHVTLLTQYEAEDVARVAHCYTRAEIQILFAAMAKDGLWSSVIRVSHGLEQSRLALTHLTQINVEAGLRTLLTHAPTNALTVSYYFAYAVDMMLSEDILVALFDACRYDLASGWALYRHLLPFQSRWSATVYACCLTLTARCCPGEALRLYDDYMRLLPPVQDGRNVTDDDARVVKACPSSASLCVHQSGPESMHHNPDSARTEDGVKNTNASPCARDDGVDATRRAPHSGGRTIGPGHTCALQNVYHIMLPLAMQHAPNTVSRYVEDMRRHDPGATPDVLLRCLTLPSGPPLACRYLGRTMPNAKAMCDAETVSLAVALYRCKPSTRNMNTLLAILIHVYRRGGGVALTPLVASGNGAAADNTVGHVTACGRTGANRIHYHSHKVEEGRAREYGHGGVTDGVPRCDDAQAHTPWTTRTAISTTTSLGAPLARARSCADMEPHTLDESDRPPRTRRDYTAPCVGVTLAALLYEMPLPSAVDVVILCRTLVEQEAPWEVIAEPFLYALLRRNPRELATVLPPLLVTLAMQQGAWAAAARVMTIYVSNQRGVLSSADVNLCVEASVKAGLWSQALFWMSRAKERHLALSQGTHRYVADARQKLMHEGIWKERRSGGAARNSPCASVTTTSQVVYGNKPRGIPNATAR